MSFQKWRRVLCFVTAFAFVAKSASAIDLSMPVVEGANISFTFPSSTDQLFTIQSAAASDAPWSDILYRRGTGEPLTFSTLMTGEQQFFRVRSSPFTPLAIQPDSPTLSSGSVSLPDAEVGSPYLQMVTFSGSGVPPYKVAINGVAPDGIATLVRSNETAEASVQISSDGNALIAGQRLEFTVEASDAENAVATNRFNLRVVTPAPRLDLAPLATKAGESVNVPLASAGGEGPLTWIATTALPDGLLISAVGVISGAPSAAAAEVNDTGVYSTVIEVADSFTDRFTGDPAPRKATATLAASVRLSYALNIRATRPGGPSLRQTCLACHGSGFPPDVDAPSATALIDGASGLGGACGGDWNFVVPGDLANSLIYRKVTAPS